MNRISQKLVQVFKSAAVILAGFICFACVDFYYDHSYDSSFTPEAFVDESYSPMFFSVYDKFNGTTDPINSSNQFFTNENIHLWYDFLDGRMTKEQIRLVLQSDSADGELETLNKALATNSSTQLGSLSGINTSHLPSIAFLRYVMLAKKIQLASIPSGDYWDYENRQQVFVSSGLVHEVTSRYESETNPFLRQRYWYQAIKARFYSQDCAQASVYFQSTHESFDRNTLYYQSMMYAAGSLMRANEYVKANLYCAEVFDKHRELRPKVLQSFKVMSEQDAARCAGMTNDVLTRSAIWALNGYFTDERLAIKRIMTVSPNSSHLDLLLTRMVNRWEFDLCNGNNPDLSKQFAGEAIRILDALSNHPDYSNKPLSLMASAYLNTLDGDLNRARSILKSLESDYQLTALQRDQLRLLKLMNSVRSLVVAPTAKDHLLLDDMRWLKLKSDDSSSEIDGSSSSSSNNLRAKRGFIWACSRISILYEREGNKAMSELFRRGGVEPYFTYSNENYYSGINLHSFFKTHSNVDLLVRFMEKPMHTEWERFAMGLYPVGAKDIHEFKAIFAAYQGDFDRAVQEMELAGDLQNNTLLGDPFKGSIKDCNDCDHAMPQSVKWTKIAFLKRMRELYQNVEMGKDVYNSSQRMANAFYNMSIYGNARFFYSNLISGEISYDKDEIIPGVTKSMRLARRYYSLALQTAPNRESEALCHYMLSKCERNEYYATNANQYSEFDDNFIAFKQWNGFYKLKTQYNDTRFYQEVIRECGYFKTYLSKRN